MNTEKEFYRMMAAQTEIALATCMESVPNCWFILKTDPGFTSKIDPPLKGNE